MQANELFKIIKANLQNRISIVYDDFGEEVIHEVKNVFELSLDRDLLNIPDCTHKDGLLKIKYRNILKVLINK